MHPLLPTVRRELTVVLNFLHLRMGVVTPVVPQTGRPLVQVRPEEASKPLVKLCRCHHVKPQRREKGARVKARPITMAMAMDEQHRRRRQK